MYKINKQLALVVAAIGCVLFLICLFTPLLAQPWFVFLIALWVFVFISCCYRLTPLFRERNSLSKLIQRNQQHLILFTLTGFFDRTSGPHWVSIESIKHIKCDEDSVAIFIDAECVFSTSLPSSKTHLINYFNSILTTREKQSMKID
ncbi:hypothetical protein [Pseudoalteromonas sp. ZZD1]|uniref:hypothetical protein n=1 Tax=Pseudoalteromonas sp. ZZD1 TaxID=3139395 RepID=UPI003BA935CE